MGERVLLYTDAPLTIPYCTGCVTVRRRLDKFRMILLELRARHRQSHCGMGAVHSPLWVRHASFTRPIVRGAWPSGQDRN
jgi:hypothetical protein